MLLLLGSFERFIEYSYGISIIEQVRIARVSYKHPSAGGYLEAGTFEFANFLLFLTKDIPAVSISFGSMLLIPFAVYTFDVVTACRRKRRQGAA